MNQPRENGTKPNILFIMTDQQRADTITALGNVLIHTPNMDRLVRRGVSFTHAFSSCPVCVPARYTIMSGCEPVSTDLYTNDCLEAPNQPSHSLAKRCGPFLPQRLRELGYRTFGIGKFHTEPWDQPLGFDTHLHSEELYFSPEQRTRDAYARYIREQHPEYDWIEMLQGERTDMYYTPQMSPLPPALTVEAWAAAEAVGQIRAADKRPWFGFVSFIGPHPPCAPPQPYNRMYNPDSLPNPVLGDPETDLADEQIRWMNYGVYAEEMSQPSARLIKSRYYGEITYLDACLGKILDTVLARPDADNTLICFFSDHGDHLGDHRAWQKESFFEAACRIPFLTSWPARLQQDIQRNDPVSLADLFGLATGAAGAQELRDGVDILQVLQGLKPLPETRFGYYGRPGTPRFKVMVRARPWKYIFMANGGLEQLFNIETDPNDLENSAAAQPAMSALLRETAERHLTDRGVTAALQDGRLKSWPSCERPLKRICQMERSRGVQGYPHHPADLAGTVRF